MAKLLITYYRSDEISAGTTLCFYDSLFRELERFGNDVMAINMAYYGVFNPNITENKCHEAYLVDQVLAFGPDVIIAFNHHILRAILKATDVPVVIYDGDELRFFADLDVIKHDIGRYKIFSIVEDWRQTYLDFGFRDDQVFYMPPGTAITNDSSVTKDKNISFLGQRRYFLSRKVFDFIQQEKDPGCLYSAYLDFLKTKDYDYVKHFLNHAQGHGGVAMEDADLWPLFDQSYLIFANLLDLGLHLGGHEGAWCDIAPFVPQIAAAHDRARVFDLEENQRFYNSSLISLCPMHPQAKGRGFSWRCYDIMGSSAGLVASTTTELRKQTKGWVDLPMFDTPAEAREICQRLLKDKAEREALVAGSNAFIEENGRWEHRFAKMEQILGLKLLDPERKGSFRKVTEQPVWMEEPGNDPVSFAVQDQPGDGSVPFAVQEQPEPIIERSKKAARLQRRYFRLNKLRAFLDGLHERCKDPMPMQILVAGELSMLAVCAASYGQVFTPFLGALLTKILLWFSAAGTLLFFAALCAFFAFKFFYRYAKILWNLYFRVLYKVRTRWAMIRQRSAVK